MKLKQYPKYKDSGVQWIGEIPEGWVVNRLKFLLSSLESGSREIGGGSQLDEGVFSLGGEHINWDGTLNLENTKLISEEYYNSMNQGKLKINDILLVKDGATIGKTAILTKKEFDKMAVNEHVFLMRSNKRINPKLLYYLICSDSGFKQIKLTEVGSAQGGINQDFIAKAYFSIPQDKQDQTAIANFLDKKTAEIDTLIEKDKKLIALLKEKRTALINHAVTKGLDKNAKMKKANLLICDKTPENWQIIRIKFVIRLSRGVDLSNDDFEEGNIPVYGSNGIIGYHNEATIKGPGVTVGRSGSVGEVNFVNEERYWAHNTSLYLQEDYGNNVRYIYYLLSILDLKHLAAGSAVGTLNRNYIHDLFVSLPSKQEQQKIVEYLNKATSKIDKTIQVIENKINLLEEYKKSLIHYVVTGKVDVKRG